MRFIIDEKQIEQLEQSIQYTFSEKQNLIPALTHTSYANEHRKEGCVHNERLEFLGDAVLELVISEYLYAKYPEKPEGDMSKLRASIVCEPTLAAAARKIGLDQHLLLGHGEIMLGGYKRDSIISDAFEAVIGAIYLDGGFEAAKAFIRTHLIEEIRDTELYVDHKTRLQELVQEQGNVPVYTLEGAEGPDHEKKFYVNVSVGDEILGRGIGRSKKAAQQQAAYEALVKLGKVRR